MTLFLRELWEKRPLVERIPPRPLAEDKIPWSGREVAKFGEIFDVVREITAAPPDETARACLAHLDARWRALFESWTPGGLRN
jgi:hypothetical protein